MNKQIYKLGETVWAFKQEGDNFAKTSGIIRMAEINKSGYIQYQVKATTILPTGELKEFTVLANHASLAYTEEEIDAKIKKYYDWSEAQKIDYNKTFGEPEYDTKEIEERVVELAQKRGK